MWYHSCLLNYSHYMFKFNNRNAGTRCEIYSKWTIKTVERRQWRRSGVVIVNFEHISRRVLVFLRLTLSRQIRLGSIGRCSPVSQLLVGKGCGWYLYRRGWSYEKSVIFYLEWWNVLSCGSGCFVSELGLGVCKLGNLLDVIRQSGTYKITPYPRFRAQRSYQRQKVLEIFIWKGRMLSFPSSIFLG